jgi:hypothetical protein
VTLIPIGGNSRKGPVIIYGGGVTEEKFFVGKNVPDPNIKVILFTQPQISI